MLWEPPEAPLKAPDESGRRGSGVLREILAVRHPDAAPTESMFETLVERILRKAGIELPVRQYEVWVDGVLVARIDFARSGSPWGKEMGCAAGWIGARRLLVSLGQEAIPARG
jgi:hypothetical protein